MESIQEEANPLDAVAVSAPLSALTQKHQRKSEDNVITDKRELAKLNIASILDHPSVYMGGPSRGSRRSADRILKYLEEEGLIRFEQPSHSQPFTREDD